MKTPSLGILFVLGYSRCLLFEAEAILEIHVAGSTSVCRQTSFTHMVHVICSVLTSSCVVLLFHSWLLMSVLDALTVNIGFG